MGELTFKARLRLLTAEQGGRSAPLPLVARPRWDIGNRVGGVPTVNDARLELAGAAPLAPGEERSVTLEPLIPELWADVRVGDTLRAQDGATCIGEATVTGIDASPLFTREVLHFVAAAREYVRFVQQADEWPLAARLRRARDTLLALYTAALALPAIKPADRRREDPAPADPKRWPGLDGFETYAEVHDPYEMDAPVRATLSDDLLGTHRDVGGALVLWDRGAHAHAIWNWRDTFQIHWGEHAADALRALHRACARCPPER